jgi:hypothetical protein
MIRTYSDTENASTARDSTPSVAMQIVTDPAQLARSREQWARFDRNAAWLQARASEVYSVCRGKCVCIAGEELFVGDTPAEAIALARTAHPEDDGLFVRYIPREKVSRIYAY